MKRLLLCLALTGCAASPNTISSPASSQLGAAIEQPGSVSASLSSDQAIAIAKEQFIESTFSSLSAHEEVLKDAKAKFRFDYNEAPDTTSVWVVHVEGNLYPKPYEQDTFFTRGDVLVEKSKGAFVEAVLMK